MALLSDFLVPDVAKESKQVDGNAILAAIQTLIANVNTNIPAQDPAGGMPTRPDNITTKFREAFEVLDTTNRWDLVQGGGDLVLLDGNAVSASYVVISKDPFTPGSVTTLTTKMSFEMPVEVVAGFSISQRAVGQEVSMELVSTEDPLPAPAELAIASISQATTTLTVNTVDAHGFVPGKRIGIYGVQDSRFNYPSLVVATIPSPTQFTCTSTPVGALPSVTAGPYLNGNVYHRSPLGGAPNGTSQIFENSTVANASFYTRASAGDVLPSGTMNGNHSVAVATSAGTQAVNAAYTYAWLPASEYHLTAQADRVQWADVGVDGIGVLSNRYTRSQVVPDPAKHYKLRFRVTNNKGLTSLVAKIVSVSKTGTTTATVVCDRPHGLTTSDFVNIYGIGDTANFPNLTVATGTQVASIVNATTFTIVIGTASTTTAYGGVVTRNNGQNLPPGMFTTVAQTATLTDGILTLVGSGTWGGSVGDYVNLAGVTARTDGTDLGLDGVYRLRNTSGNTLEMERIDGGAMPADFTVTNCNGAVIKRTDLRLGFVRIFDFLRHRIEFVARPSGDVQSGAAVHAILDGGAATANAVLVPNTISADIGSVAITVTATSAAITPGNGSLAHEFFVNVTAVSGTNPTMDVVVQESDDTGTNWFDVYHFPRITSVGQYRSPMIPLTGNRIRYVRTVAGTTPSFTNAINRQQSQMACPLQRQFYDRALVPNTASSTTATWLIEGCATLKVSGLFTAIGVAPVLAFEVSDDNVNWFQIGADITPVANVLFAVTASDALWHFARLRVKTAGSGTNTLSYLSIKGVGR